jgi:aspartate aminotransferase
MSAKADAMRADGIDVISLSAGEPDFDTPDQVIDAAERALRAGKTRYTATPGIPQLREAIAEGYGARGRDVSAEQVIVTVGGKQALFNAHQVLFDEGDEVLNPAPYWVSYPAQAKLADATPHVVECDWDQSFKLSPQQLDRAIDQGQIRGIILCSPSNPTGAVYTESELQQLAEVIDRADHDITILFDAIYDRLDYDRAYSPDLAAVAPEIADQVITFNGFSKTYAMTGWRLGYAIADESIISAMSKLQSQQTSNATTFCQWAALEALELGDEVLGSRRQAFKDRRDVIVDGLRQIDGVHCPEPAGAFYVFPDFSSYIDAGEFDDDMALAEYLLDEAHVATVPGSAFGMPGGIRMSYAASMADIEEALQRIQDALS